MEVNNPSIFIAATGDRVTTRNWINMKIIRDFTDNRLLQRIIDH